MYEFSAVVSTSVYVAPLSVDTSTRYFPSSSAPSPFHETVIDERSSDTTGLFTAVTVGATPASL